jgi:molybdenum cofactor cytidylyltransferase
VSEVRLDHTSSQSRIGVAVLAAGASTRMGTPKQLLIYQGKTLIRRAVETALASVCDPVVVVLGANAVAVGNELELPVVVARNPEWETGMSSSVRVGLETLLATDRGMDGVVMMLCDQPFVTPELIDRLVERRRQTRKSIVATDYHRTYGVPALFASELFQELAGLTGDYGARRIIQKHGYDAASVLFTDAAIDVDTPRDYNALQAASPRTH